METEFKTELIWRRTLPTKTCVYVLANFYEVKYDNRLRTGLFYINEKGKFCNIPDLEIDTDNYIVSWAFIPYDTTLSPFK